MDLVAKAPKTKCPGNCTDWAIPNLKFIATKDKLYLYLQTFKGDKSIDQEFVYDLDVSCTTADNCPKIGTEEQFSNVFVGLSQLKSAYIQDGFTYFVTNSVIT